MFKIIKNLYKSVLDLVVGLKYLDTPVLCIYLLKQNRVIAPDEIHESYPDKNIYRKDPKFSDRSSGKTVQTEISLLYRNQSD